VWFIPLADKRGVSPKEKDLGVFFTKELKVAEIVTRLTVRLIACMLGLISRTIKYKNPVTLFYLSTSTSLVRPHLDYCSLFGILIT